MAKSLEKRLYTLTLFLMKEEATSFDDCVKQPGIADKTSVKDSMGFSGCIYTCESKNKPPSWLVNLNEISKEKIVLGNNVSNKAVLIAHIDDRYIAIVFGYGRSLLREEMIERNFGLRVALNIVNPKKMRSVNAATIEDMVVTSQIQSSQSTSQDEFGLNITNDIVRGITGEIEHERYGKSLCGKDSLVVTVFMNVTELRDKLKLYIEAYRSELYKLHGFEWVDNICEVKDAMLSEELDFELAAAITNRDFLQLHAAPPEIIDWERVTGFCFSGVRYETQNPNDYKPIIDVIDYFSRMRADTDIIHKLKRDRLFAKTVDDSFFAICSVYTLLIYQVTHESNKYVLCAGNWYLINEQFYNQVMNAIAQIPESTIELPICSDDWDEGKYNETTANSSAEFCLLDKVPFRIVSGATPIEACDIYDISRKAFIHVKNKGKSSQLSHLFAQGRVSAQCFAIDVEYRKQVADEIFRKAGEKPYSYESPVQSREYEVVYAIIDKDIGSLAERLPFFSLVNLMLASLVLNTMHFKYSYKIVRRIAQ